MISSKLFEEIVAILKKRPGKEELKPENLKEAIERATIEISRFCRIRILTDEFKYLIADIANDIYDMEAYNKLEHGKSEDEDIDSRVKMLKQGDTTIELSAAKTLLPYATMAEIMKAHSVNLVPYRSIYWR